MAELYRLPTGPVARCELTELLVSECAHCRGFEEEPVVSSRGQWFTATYSGRCSNCKTSFEPGDRIRADGFMSGGWLAECCGEDEDG